MRYLITLLILLSMGCRSTYDNSNAVMDAGTPLLVNSDQVDMWFQKHDLNAPGLNDEYYVVITPTQLQSLVSMTNSLRVQYDLKWTKELTDCDNFARLFQAVSPFILQTDTAIDADLLIFVVIVKQDVSWGTVPSGGMHALVGIMTTDGPFIIEPQTGQYAKLKEYPNKIITIRDQ